LVPGSSSHLRSISEGVLIEQILDALTENEKARFESLDRTIRVWGTTSARRNIWESMREGDHVLFVPSGSGMYTYYGEVSFFTHNAALAQKMENLGIWPKEGRKYEYLFFVGNFKEISIPKRKVNEIVPWTSATPRQFMRVANEIVRAKIIEFLGGKGERPPSESEDELSRLRTRIIELERELQEHKDIVRSLKSPPSILTDLELQRLTDHDQIVYKLALALMAFDFKNVQLDLSSGLDTPPFTAEQKIAFRVRGREYDVKAEYDGNVYVWEVHHKGMLVPTLVKLNELTAANKALVLYDSEDEKELRREARRRQFRDLISVPPFELRKYMKGEIEELYDFSKTFYSLKHQIETQQTKLTRNMQLLDEKRNMILQRSSFFEEVF